MKQLRPPPELPEPRAQVAAAAGAGIGALVGSTTRWKRVYP